jgi:hypothetical protein
LPILQYRSQLEWLIFFWGPVMLFSWLSVCCSNDVFSTTKAGKAERRPSPQLSFPCPTSSLSRRHFIARRLIQTQTVKRHTRPSIYYGAQLCKGKLKPEVHQHLGVLQRMTLPPPTRPVCTELREKRTARQGTHFEFDLFFVAFNAL